MIYGRGGADVMTGSDEPDRLDGGGGFDIARGRGGNDTCKAAENALELLSRCATWPSDLRRAGGRLRPRWPGRRRDVAADVAGSSHAGHPRSAPGE